MGLLDPFNADKRKQFVSEEKFEEILLGQTEILPRAIELLREVDISPDKELKVEFFFYTNTLERAKDLAITLEKLNYDVYEVCEAGFKKGCFSVVGCTHKMLMTEGVIVHWAEQMCELGYIHNCEFDGWGTTDAQLDDE